MKLDLSTVVNSEGAALPFERSFDLSDYDLPGGVRPFKNPVRVWGEVRNSAGAVGLKMNIDALLCFDCDRCLKPFTKQLELLLTADIVKEIHDETRDDLILIAGDKLDIQELAFEHILLKLSAKHLCDEDCKGLCPICGTDLNSGACSCDTRGIDPRLEALKNFFS